MFRYCDCVFFSLPDCCPYVSAQLWCLFRCSFRGFHNLRSFFFVFFRCCYGFSLRSFLRLDSSWFRNAFGTFARDLMLMILFLAFHRPFRVNLGRLFVDDDDLRHYVSELVFCDIIFSEAAAWWTCSFQEVFHHTMIAGVFMKVRLFYWYFTFFFCLSFSSTLFCPLSVFDFRNVCQFLRRRFLCIF